jgi:hypothetical protein
MPLSEGEETAGVFADLPAKWVPQASILRPGNHNINFNVNF